jgi:hypothetical protein
MKVYDQTSELQLEGRNRGEAWSDYESRWHALTLI